jgi:CheY-like chemotaxis protein
MPTVLIGSVSPFDDDLGPTVLSRDDVVRHWVQSADEVLEAASLLSPDLILLDRDMPQADRAVAGLRRDRGTRRTSIVVIARGELDPVEVELLEAGANAILRLPVAPEWDERLERLMEVPVRRETRFGVSFEVEARTGSGVESASATALNVSTSGMLIDSAFPLHIGDDVDFAFQLPGSDAWIRGCGRVVRQAGRTQFGVEFYGLEGDGRELLSAWTASSGGADL